MIKIEHLHKSFGSVQAVQDLSLSVKAGSLFAFLGSNGAGKSTTINIMCGQLEKDSGRILIDGADLDQEPDRMKRSIGVVFQDSVLDSSLTVRDNLISRGALYGMSRQELDTRIAELTEILDFADLLKRTVSKLSGGQRRRVDIARALLHKPKLLVLDEPTTGLDPQTRHLLWEVLTRIRKESGMTIFLTTHYMEEAAEADYVVILDSGKIAAEGTPHTLKNTYTADYITLYNVDEESVKALQLPYETVGGAFRLSVPNTAAATELILRHPQLFQDYEITKGKMDDVFLNATGKKLEGGDEK